MRIYIDFDDVICETARSFCELALSLFQIEKPYEEVRFFNLQKAFGLDEKQYKLLMAEGHTPETLSSYTETPGACKTINAWKNTGHDVKIITGRPFDCYEISRQWLDQHGLEEIPLFHVNKYGRETFYQDNEYNLSLEDMYRLDFDFAVEDSPSAFEHLSHFTHCEVAVFDRPWNQDAFLDKNYHRCRGWDEIDALLQKMM